MSSKNETVSATAGLVIYRTRLPCHYLFFHTFDIVVTALRILTTITLSLLGVTIFAFATLSRHVDD